MDGLKVRFWGTRGSCSAPFGNRMEYGGNTSCVSVRYDDGLVIFDAGTGIVALGRQIEEEYKMGRWNLGNPIHLFISHLHLDHIQGLPFFSWLFQKGAEIHMYGMRNEDISFRQRIAAVFGPPYWPVSIEQVPATIVWHEINPEETVELSDDVRVHTLRADHPNGGQLFRIEGGCESVVYGLDCELGEASKKQNTNILDITAISEDKTTQLTEQKTKTEESEGLGSSMWERYRAFAKGCGMLIFDAPYTEETYPQFQGYGHSFWQQGLLMAKECGAKRLSICHHDWGRTDCELAELEQTLKEQAVEIGICAEFAREE